MAKVLMFLAALLLYVTGVFDQDADGITPPIAEFPRTPIPFFEFRWVGETLYMSARDALYVFRPDDNASPQVWRSFSNEWDFVHITPNADMIIAEDLDAVTGELTIYRLLTDGVDDWREEVMVIPAGNAVPPWTAYSRDGKLAAILVLDWTVERIELRLYDLDAAALLWTADIDETEQYVLNELEFSHDGRYLAVAGETNTVMVWDTALGKMIDRVTSPDEFDILRGVNFSPDGRFMYVVGFQEIFVSMLRQTSDGNQWSGAAVHPISTEFSNLLLSADGRTLIGTAYQTGEIYVWNVDGSEISVRRRLTVQDGRWLLRLPTISYDGRYLAAADIDGVIRVWRL